MKCAIAVALLVAVIGVYSEEQSTIGSALGSLVNTPSSSGLAVNENLTPQDLTEIQTIFNEVLGPQLSTSMTELVATLVNGTLGKVPVNSVVHKVVELSVKLLKTNGVVNKLLGGGNSNAAGGGTINTNGQLKNLTPDDQAGLIKTLSRYLGPYTAMNIVKLVANLTNGLVSKVPLHGLLHGVSVLMQKVLSKNAVKKLLGSQSLDGLISAQLGASGNAS